MNGINVGKVIYNILSTNSAVTSLADNKIYPLVAHLGTTYPFITYSRNSILVGNTKDKFICSEIADVQILAVSDNYEESLNLAQAIHTALNGKTGTYNGIEITDIMFESIQETYQDDAIAQIINYKIYLK